MEILKKHAITIFKGSNNSEQRRERNLLRWLLILDATHSDDKQVLCTHIVSTVDATCSTSATQISPADHPLEGTKYIHKLIRNVSRAVPIPADSIGSED